MTLRLPRYSLWYPLLVALIWAYPLSWDFSKQFWAFLYLDILHLQPYILKHFIGISLILLAIFSGAAIALNAAVWIVPRFRKAIHPHWSTNLAAFAALWIFYGTIVTLLSRQYPYIPMPTEQEKTMPGDVSGNA